MRVFKSGAGLIIFILNSAVYGYLAFFYGGGFWRHTDWWIFKWAGSTRKLFDNVNC